jgi:hypothetical protein
MLVTFAASRARRRAATHEDEMRQSLLTAKVVKTRARPKELREYETDLSDGRITHEASFQAIDEFKATAALSR